MNSDTQTENQRERFTKEEDQKLNELVNKYGPKNWNFIVSLHKTKNATQCRGKWTRYLSPSISRTS
jgi:hypothetical protein